MEGCKRRMSKELKKSSKYMQDNQPAKAERARLRARNIREFMNQKTKEASTAKLKEFKTEQKEKIEKRREEAKERAKHYENTEERTGFIERKNEPEARAEKKASFDARLNEGE